MKRATYHHGSLKEDVIRLGRQHLARVGEAELSLREVARELGVSPAAPYRHFPDKDALLSELALEGWRDLGSRLKTVANLTEQLKAYQTFAEAEPELLRLMFNVTPGKNGKAFADATMAAFSALSSVTGSIVPTSTDIKLRFKGAIFAWSLIHGLVTLNRQRGNMPFVESVGLSERDVESFLRVGLNAWRGPV